MPPPRLLGAIPLAAVTLDDRVAIEPSGKAYALIGRDGKPYESPTPGAFGGHRKARIYGRLDCPCALHWISKGHYVRRRVFFADEKTAIAAGYRPCAACMPEEHSAWKADRKARG